jgi:hypothetical protein
VRYRYPVVCVSCGWRDANEDQDSSAELGVNHLAECGERDPAISVPMWSIGWPYYWAVERGETDADAFTFEVGWLTRPNYVEYGPPSLMSGMDAKHYYYFEAEANRTIYGAAA